METEDEAERDEARRENTVLRGLVAEIVKPCHYCGAETMAKCPRGFPGCALADDLLVADDVMLTDETTLRFKKRALAAEASVDELRRALNDVEDVARAGISWAPPSSQDFLNGRLSAALVRVGLPAEETSE